MKKNEDKKNITSSYLEKLKYKKREKHITVVVCTALAVLVGLTTVTEMIRPAEAVTQRKSRTDNAFLVHMLDETEDGNVIIEEESQETEENGTEITEENDTEITEEPVVTENQEPAAETKEDTSETEEPVNTETAENTEETETAEPEEEPVYMPAQDFYGETEDLNITVYAPEGAFPEGTLMEVSAVYDEAVLNAAAGAAESNETKVTKVQAADITFRDAEGNDIEPLVPIQVIMTPAERLPEETETTAVYHIDDQGEAAEVELKEETTSEAVVFDAESFSVYALVYTVDFHWEVDGKTYEYNLSGGCSVGLRELISVLNLLDDEIDIDKFMNDIDTVTFSDEDLLKVIPVTEDITSQKLKEIHTIEPEYSAAVTDDQKAEMDAAVFTAPDWALFSLKSFSTDETLTITMKNGEVWTISVSDPVTDTAPSDMTVLNTADTRSQGIKMWLFDYDLDHSLDNQNNKANTDNNKQDGINALSDYKFLGWGAGNAKDAATGINDFTGLDNDNGNNIRALQGIVKNTLEGGYPVLNNSTSLSYLFNPDANTDDRTVYGGNSDQGNINKLFEYKDGYYIYDSDEHYAELNEDNLNFTVYTSTLAQTNKNGGLHSPPRSVGFFPFDTYEHVYNDLKYENDPTQYGNNGTLYVNPDGVNGASGLNHHLGVAMEMDFIIPKNGVDENGTPIKFNFSGDDDMWVFIDDQLVLDIGGLHQPVDGTIDFSKGIATITGKATQTGHTDNTGANAIVTADGAINPRGNDFKFYPALNMPNGGDGKTHTMKIFYVERGGCDSNCMISFNLPLVKGKADATVAKYDKSANPVKPLKGVKFGLYSDADCTDLIEEVTSGNNGLLLFENLPIKDDNQKYYLRETVPLPGYKTSTDIYTLKVAEDSSRNYYFKVMKDDTEIETIGQNPKYPVIYNEPIEPINLQVEKQWKDMSGNSINPPYNASATFQVKRYCKYEGDVEETITVEVPENTVNVYRHNPYNNHDELVFSRDYKRGTSASVSWSYNSYYAREGKTQYYVYRINNEDWQSNSNTGGSVTRTVPQSGELNVYIMDEWMNYNGGATLDTNGGSITSSGESGATRTETSTEIRHVVTDWAEDTNYSGSTLTLPNNSIDAAHPWIGKFENLPLFEQKDDLIYMYKYYIVETAKTPSDSQVVYVDGNGQQVSDPAELQTDTSGTQTVINKIPKLDLGVEKVNKDDHSVKLEGVVFELYLVDEKTVPVNGVKHKDNKVYGTVTTDQNGRGTFMAIEPGWYEVKETLLPEGYVLTGEDAFYIKVTKDGIQLLIKDMSKAPEEWEAAEGQDGDGGLVYQMQPASDTTPTTAVVENELGASLPSTGGSGTQMIYLWGGLLVLGAGLFMIRRRKLV